MKTRVECWNVGMCRGTDKVCESINAYAERNNLEIVGITYASGDVIVVFKEADNEQREAD